MDKNKEYATLTRTKEKDKERRGGSKRVWRITERTEILLENMAVWKHN